MNPNELLERLIARTKSLHSTLVSMRNEGGIFHELDQDSIKHQLRELYTLSGQLNQPSSDFGKESETRRVRVEDSDIVVEVREENSGLQSAIHAILEESVHPPANTEQRPTDADALSTPVLKLENEAKSPQAASWPDEPAIHAGLEEAGPAGPAAQSIIGQPEQKVTSTPQMEIRHTEHALDAETEVNRSLADRFTPSETVGDIILRNQPVQRVSDKLRSTPLSDLHESIGINERFAFINQLFKGDQARYFDTINRLNGARSQDEALQFLNEELLPGMAWKTPPAAWKEFVELISRRYQA